MKVVLFGVGNHIDAIEGFLQTDVEVLFYVDNDAEKQTKLRNNKKIYSLKDFPDKKFDYIIITAVNFKSIEEQLIENGYSRKRIISFFEENLNYEDYNNVFIPMQSAQYSFEWRIKSQMKRIESAQRVFHENFIFEMADRIKKENIELPHICSVEETCDKIIRDKVSVSRYGDGEFEIIFGSSKTIFQDNNKELGQRLKEILISNQNGHIVALADDYGCMDGFREENRYYIRLYMTNEKRRQHYQCIDMNKQYYNAYISRPYVIYPHNEREKASNRFKSLKKIWDKKKILLVEGEYTRMGVGNDLFSNASSIERIIAPSKNAFTVYQEILEAVLKVNKDRLVLISLGPTATVLAYDLARKGFWAIDIGHLDLEYEWYLKGEGYSVIPNKYNNEVAGGTFVGDIVDESYSKSIIRTIIL